MDSPRVAYTPRTDATSREEPDVLASLYRLAIQRYEENEPATESAQLNDHDATESKPGGALENSS